ncbi:MAG: hypothetical protein Q7R30_20030 [Acidobacteriota bacterium]|nr:hypothetical protein [Acidobacteriota bacterium]
MSKKKKKGKPAAKKTSSKAAKRASASRRTPRVKAGAATGRTSQATIFIFRSPTGTKVRTAPQRLYAGPGHIAWSVVNLVDGSNVPVTITWPDGGPWGKEPIEIRDGWARISVAGAASGRFKYVVHGLDAQEDPEVEIPDM